MFNRGQLIFAAVALLVFIVIIAFSYRKDKKVNKAYFKKSYIVLIAFILFIAFLTIMKLTLG